MPPNMKPLLARRLKSVNHPELSSGRSQSGTHCSIMAIHRIQVGRSWLNPDSELQVPRWRRENRLSSYRCPGPWLWRRDRRLD